MEEEIKFIKKELEKLRGSITKVQPTTDPELYFAHLAEYRTLLSSLIDITRASGSGML